MNTRMIARCVGQNCGATWVYPHYRNCPHCKTPADPGQITAAKAQGFVDTPDETVAPAKVVHMVPKTHVDLRMGMEKDVATTMAEMADKNLTGVLIMGYNANGDIVTNCNIDDGGSVLWLIEKAKFWILSGERK